MANPLKYGFVILNVDRPVITHFDDYGEFRANCRTLEAKLVPYTTYERRVRKDGRWLWCPCETRFFDANGGGGR